MCRFYVKGFWLSPVSWRFRKLREACRNHFHLSWYLLVPGITSYSQKPWGGFFFTVHDMWQVTVAHFVLSRTLQNPITPYKARIERCKAL